MVRKVSDREGGTDRVSCRRCNFKCAPPLGVRPPAFPLASRPSQNHWLIDVANMPATNDANITTTRLPATHAIFSPVDSCFSGSSSPLVVLHTKLGREADPLEVEIPAIQFFHLALSLFSEKRMPLFFIATDLTNLFCVEGASDVCSGLMSAALTLRSGCHRHPSALINGRNSLPLAMQLKSINCACLSSRYSKSRRRKSLVFVRRAEVTPRHALKQPSKQR